MSPRIFQRVLWVTLAVALLVIGGLAVAKWERTPTLHLQDYGALPPFSLLDQSGTPVSLNRFQGHIWVADMFFTHCTTLCPIITRRMLSIETALKDDPRVRFASVSVDPRHDPPDTLRAYAAALGADTSRWTFLTGSTHSVYDLIKDGFHMPVDSVGGDTTGNTEGIPIIHSPRLIVFDARGHMRSFYNGALPDAQQHILADISALEAESGQ